MRAAIATILLLGSACTPPSLRGGKRADSMDRALDSKPAAGANAIGEGKTPSARHEDVEYDEIGVGTALSHETMESAVTRAREDALSKAMLGAADVFYGFSDYSTESGRERRESVAKYLFTSNQGVLTEITSGSPECAVKDRVTTCRLRVRGKIAFRGAIDPAFLILDQSSGKPMGLDRRQYYQNEVVKLALAVTKDAYVYVFSWDEADALSPVFPNAIAKSNFLKAGTPLFLPEDNPGLNYRAMLPSGKASASERLLIIATRRELMERPWPKMGSLAEVMRRLAALDRREWTLQAAPYEIVTRPGGN